MKKIFTIMLMLLLLTACGSDEPEVQQDELPNVCFAKEGGLYINGIEGTVVGDLTRIYSLDVADGKLCVYGKNSYNNCVIWCNDNSQVLNIPSDINVNEKSPFMDNGNAYFLTWPRSSDFYVIMGFPNGKTFQLPKVASAAFECFAVHGDEYFACANVAVPVHMVDIQNGAYVWVNGRVIQLCDNLSARVWAINGLHGHYYAIGPYNIELNEYGNEVWSHMGYWRDGQLQELDKKDADRASPYFIHMHGDTPIVYGHLQYEALVMRACVWIDGKYMDLSQGHNSDVYGVRSYGNDWYAFVRDKDSNQFVLWRNGKLLESYNISDVVDFTVY